MRTRHQKPVIRHERPRAAPYLYGSDREGAGGKAYFASAGGGAIC